MDKDEQEEAKERIANMTQAAKELTRDLGLPPEDMFDVLYMTYFNRLPPEVRDASDVKEPMAEQEKRYSQSQRDGWVMTVTIGTLVTVQARKGEIRVFRLLGPYQPQLPIVKIRSRTGYNLIYPVSYESPIGEALMGHKIGDRVWLDLPGMTIGTKEFVILDIKYENRRKF